MKPKTIQEPFDLLETPLRQFHSLKNAHQKYKPTSTTTMNKFSKVHQSAIYSKTLELEDLQEI